MSFRVEGLHSGSGSCFSREIDIGTGLGVQICTLETKVVGCKGLEGNFHTVKKYLDPAPKDLISDPLVFNYRYIPHYAES